MSEFGNPVIRGWGRCLYREIVWRRTSCICVGAGAARQAWPRDHSAGFLCGAIGNLCTRMAAARGARTAHNSHSAHRFYQPLP